MLRQRSHGNMSRQRVTAMYCGNRLRHGEHAACYGNVLREQVTARGTCDGNITCYGGVLPVTCHGNVLRVRYYINGDILRYHITGARYGNLLRYYVMTKMLRQRDTLIICCGSGSRQHITAIRCGDVLPRDIDVQSNTTLYLFMSRQNVIRQHASRKYVTATCYCTAIGFNNRVLPTTGYQTQYHGTSTRHDKKTSTRTTATCCARLRYCRRLLPTKGCPNSQFRLPPLPPKWLHRKLN